jgi:hypothetical protein
VTAATGIAEGAVTEMLAARAAAAASGNSATSTRRIVVVVVVGDMACAAHRVVSFPPTHVTFDSFNSITQRVDVYDGRDDTLHSSALSQPRKLIIKPNEKTGATTHAATLHTHLSTTTTTVTYNTINAMRAAPPPRPAAAAALFLLVILGAIAGLSATSEVEFADADQQLEAPTSSTSSSSSTSSRASSPSSDARPAPAELIHSSVDADTGLRTDTFIKPLGRLAPGQVMNTRLVFWFFGFLFSMLIFWHRLSFTPLVHFLTWSATRTHLLSLLFLLLLHHHYLLLLLLARRLSLALPRRPWGAAGALARPAPAAAAAILVVRVTFDLVDGDTRASLPLDATYNHHLGIESRPNAERRKAEAGEKEFVAAARLTRGVSAPVLPCGLGLSFAGGGAEWRGRQAVDDAAVAGGDPWLASAHLWVEPPGTEWGVNAHVIDLRRAARLADTVQCNCGAYSLRTPGTPQDWDHSPLPGGGIRCCGDGALGAIAPSTSTEDERAAVPVSLLYNVTWLPNTTEATARMPDDVRALAAKAPLQSTIMVSSSPMLDGASCAGEYNSKPCGGSKEDMARWTRRVETLGEQAPAPTDQTCGDAAADGSGAPVTVAWSHPFRLTAGTAYEVRWMVGPWDSALSASSYYLLNFVCLPTYTITTECLGFLSCNVECAVSECL